MLLWRGKTGDSAAGDDGYATAVATHLSLESVLKLLPDIEAQPYALQECTVSPGLLLCGVKWKVCSGCSVPGCMPLSGFQLPVPLVCVAGCGEPRLGFCLLQAGRHALNYSEASGSPFGSFISSLVVSYSNVAGYPVEPDPPPLCGQAL